MTITTENATSTVDMDANLLAITIRRSVFEMVHFAEYDYWD